MHTLYLIRHGETDWNADGRTMGQTDVPLNAKGLRQARETAEWLARFPLQAVITSDLRRARQTAEPLAAAAGVTLEEDARLRELRFGVFEGRTVAQCANEHPETVERWRGGTFDFAPPGGETRRELVHRVRAFLDEALARPAGNVAVVTHGGVLNALHSLLIESALPEPREVIHRVFRFNNASVSVSTHAAGAWRLRLLNSTFHLSEEPLVLAL